MEDILNPSDPATLLLALLICAHMLGDFVFQSRAMAAGKGTRSGPLLRHGAALTAIALVLVLPFFPSFLGAILILASGAVHMASDRAKARISTHFPAAALWWFFLDQLLHLAVALALWKLWCAGTDLALRPADPQIRATLVRGVLVVATFAFNINGGAAIVALVLRGARLDADPRPPEDTLAMGRLIGILERMLLLAMVLAGAWSGVGLVLAAKSVARFKQLEDRRFAEYYLLGTLASTLVAVASGLLLTALL